MSGKKIVAFCVWGTDPKYTVGALRNAELIKDIYPGWVARFYVGTSVSPVLVQKLSQCGAETVRMSEVGDWSGMFWRFAPAGEPDVEIMLSRDVDSRLSERESAAVAEWVRSDKQFHIMRDHPAHMTEILGGMWGAKRGAISDINSLIMKFRSNQQNNNYWQVDQNFLRDIVYPRIKHTAMVHDEFFSNHYNDGGMPFPWPRKNYEFVGDVFDSMDQRHPDYWKALVTRR
jgi:hypothetical protein